MSSRKAVSFAYFRGVGSQAVPDARLWPVRERDGLQGHEAVRHFAHDMGRGVARKVLMLDPLQHVRTRGTELGVKGGGVDQAPPDAVPPQMNKIWANEQGLALLAGRLTRFIGHGRRNLLQGTER